MLSSNTPLPKNEYQKIITDIDLDEIDSYITAPTAILVVDDDVETAIELSEIVEEISSEVYVANSAKQAIEMVEANKDIVLVITDVNMPEISGLEMIQQLDYLSDESRVLDFIIITGESKNNIIIQALRLGAIDFIKKPVSVDTLTLAIEKSLANTRLQYLQRTFQSNLQKAVTIKTAETMEYAEEIVLKNEQLNKALDTKRNFLALINHEMRTPMNAIIGFSDLLKVEIEKLHDTKSSGYCDEIQSASLHLLDMLNNIFAVIDAESGSVKIVKTDFNLNTLINELTGEHYQEANERNIIIEYEAINLNSLVHLDREILKNALTPIISNAIKFSLNDSRIRIRAEQTYNSIEIKVIDQGKGIALSEPNDIFKTFYQADQSDTKQHYGLGLGLTLSRLYLEMQNCSVYVESTNAQGTIIAINLPINTNI